MHSARGEGSSSMAGKPMLGDLSMADITRQGPATLGRPGELDNWPSTQAQGSHSWLKRLERFLDSQMERVGKDDLEGRLKVHHECLAQFSEVFKNYRPLLSRIYQAYSAYIKESSESLNNINEMRASMFTVRETAEEDVRRGEREMAERLKSMQAKVDYAEQERKKAMRDCEAAQLEVTAAERRSEEQRTVHASSEERLAAFCSGYKWIYKKVVQTDAPNDLDLLENVTLIKALERAQADANSSQFQIQYLTSTSEVASLRGILQEERRLFGIEMEKLITEMDVLRHEVSQLRGSLERSERAGELVKEDLEKLKEQMDKLVLPAMGVSDDVPDYLRTSRGVCFHTIGREETIELCNDFLRRCQNALLEEGVFPDANTLFPEVVLDRYMDHSRAEWMRNVIEAVTQHRDEATCEVVSDMLSQRLGPHALLAHSQLPHKLAFGIQEAAARLRPDVPREQAAVSSKELSENMSIVLPGKPTKQSKELAGLLSADDMAKASFSSSRFTDGPLSSTDATLLSLLRAQVSEASKQDGTGLRDALLEIAEKHKSKQGLKKVNVLDMKAAFMQVDPNKPVADLCQMLWRAARLEDLQEATALAKQDETHDAEEYAMLYDGAKLHLVQRVLVRLSLSGLIDRTGPAAAAVLAEEAKVAAAPKPPTTGSTKGEVAEGEEKPDGTEGEGASGDGWAKPKPVLEDDQDAEHPTVWSSQAGRSGQFSAAVAQALVKLEQNQADPSWVQRLVKGSRDQTALPLLEALVQLHQGTLSNPPSRTASGGQ